MSRAPAVCVDSVSVVRSGTRILSNLNFRVEHGEHWAVFGPNGSGKSTLAAVLSATLWPTEGSVSVLGETYGRVNLRTFRQRVGVFQPAQQQGLDVFHPRLSALDVICTGSDASLAVYREYSAETRKRAQELFDGLLFKPGDRAGFSAERPFAKLSSGERRKVLLLRMLMANPELVILDEPYESLDLRSRLELEQVLGQVARRAVVLIILHRVEEIPPFVSHGLLLKDGGVFQAAPIAEAIESESLSMVFDTPITVGREAGRFYWIPAAVATPGSGHSPG